MTQREHFIASEREHEDLYIEREWDDEYDYGMPDFDDGWDENEGWYEDDYSYLDDEDEEVPF